MFDYLGDIYNFWEYEYDFPCEDEDYYYEDDEEFYFTEDEELTKLFG